MGAAASVEEQKVIDKLEKDVIEYDTPDAACVRRMRDKYYQVLKEAEKSITTTTTTTNTTGGDGGAGQDGEKSSEVQAYRALKEEYKKEQEALKVPEVEVVLRALEDATNAAVNLRRRHPFVVDPSGNVCC